MIAWLLSRWAAPGRGSALVTSPELVAARLRVDPAGMAWFVAVMRRQSYNAVMPPDQEAAIVAWAGANGLSGVSEAFAVESLLWPQPADGVGWVVPEDMRTIDAEAPVFRTPLGPDGVAEWHVAGLAPGQLPSWAGGPSMLVPEAGGGLGVLVAVVAVAGVAVALLLRERD